VTSRHISGRNVSARLAQLEGVRGQYTAEARGLKIHILGALEDARLRTPGQLRSLHESLLFLRAFPDDAQVLAVVDRGLQKVATRVRALAARARVLLSDSAIAGSVSAHTFEAPIAQWLSKRFARDAEIDWAGVRNASGLEFLMALVVLRAEQDGLENSGLSARHWLIHAKGHTRESDLAWLLRQLARIRDPGLTGLAIYDHLEIPVVWRLRNGPGAAGNNLLPVDALAFRTGLRRTPATPKRMIATKLPGIRRLGPRDASRVLDITRAALTARCREVYALAHANIDEVYLADLGQGAAVAVYGVIPARRLSLESNFGYLLLANGVPIGYGGVTPLYRQANTGINVFDAFRGSEAGYLWIQILRVFTTLFGVRRFVVNPYQFGAGNSEGIASGAFWFYYRLGFRPSSPILARVAAREWGRLRRRRRYRTSASILRRLTGCDLELELPRFHRRDRFNEAWLADVGLRASQVLSNAGGTDRHADRKRTTERVASALGVYTRNRWPKTEREAFSALAPVVSLLDLSRLSRRARSDIVKLMRAKGRQREIPYVLAAARNRNVLPGLIALARRGWSNGR
jgi:hypothetical protein